LTAVADRLACPTCRGSLASGHIGLHCPACRADYPISKGVADLRPRTAADKPEVAAWTEHWSPANQRTVWQRVFSAYRKAVFAPAIAHYVDRYLPTAGFLVEAGSGTSETSMRIDKRGGARVLAAVDLVLPVLRRCHPVMDVRIGGDVFQLPFASGSVDGIWNVGVMEHFEHEQIDRMLQEFRRVLRPGGRFLLFWPGRDSVPQRMLRLVELFVNAGRERTFRFHPDEISQLRSLGQGRDVVRRNGFDVVEADYGVRTLLAFKILIGAKPQSMEEPVDASIRRSA